MTNVSTRQLRYWEEKNFIQSIKNQTDNSYRRYQLRTVIKVTIIKEYLDEGYKLSKAVEKAEEKIKKINRFRQLLAQTLKDIELIDDSKTAFSLGPCKGSADSLYIIHDEQTNQLVYQQYPHDSKPDNIKLKSAFDMQKR
ncbi:hypothetical protein CBF37_06050 [Vagococcus vulneris]|uniref:HTH merR-type domain-containing protein n=2 Tax=Vagococcus vulneris TaxID=1977869 RepID=A0A429ZYI3_9ENTE|nr:hypothetical protein CBF37_06050 [Vagococcus vulneris]